MNLDKIIFLALFTIGLCSPVATQLTSPQDNKNYLGEKLNFTYPADWKIMDKSTQQIQQLNLTPETGNALIMIIAYRPKISTQDEFEQVKGAVTAPYFEKLTKSFGQLGQIDICTKIIDSKVPGLRLNGLYNKEESTSDIFSFAIGNKFFSLIYMRANKESSKTDLAWDTVTKSLRVENKNSDKSSTILIDAKNNAVLNPKAIKLTKPIYPSGTGALVDQTIEVRVTIDENGSVISTKAISGNIRFYPAAEQAAKDSKFSPSYMCGEVTKISGIIVYNFVARP